MKLSVGDYVILDQAKKQLAKVVHAEKPFKAILESARDSDSDRVLPVEFKLSEVLANLGKSPRSGSVHGVKIEPLYRKVDSKFFSSVHLYQDMTDTRYEAFRSEMITFIKTLKAKRLTGVQVELHVRPVSGKYAGYYKYRHNHDFDILCVKPNEALDGLQYVFAHEYGHGIHYRMLPRHLWLKWINAYHDHVIVTSIDEAELSDIREDIEGARSVTEYLKDCTEDTKPVIRACLKYISQVHGLSKHHLEHLLHADESLSSIWPSLIDLSNKNMVVSEYAEKSPEEFFAECFAFHFLGRTLPKSLKSLMDRSLSELVKPNSKGN